MTYALSWPLQRAIYDTLAADPTLTALLGGRIYDAPPPFEADAAPDAIWVTLGDERVDDWSTKDSSGAVHMLAIAVHAPQRGFGEAKDVAGVISDVLTGAALAPERGRVVHVGFVSGRTRRSDNDLMRRVELRFRVLVEDA
ncbi:MAG TPA: DUF3168 domain-containing protein [Thermohalobaculum sp.]|nr:DUF3168 domain-containing protein [Thermohalobaculum sp.]